MAHNRRRPASGILVLESSRRLKGELMTALRSTGRAVTFVSSLATARKELQQKHFELALLNVGAFPASPRTVVQELPASTVYVLLTDGIGRRLPKAEHCGCRPQDVLAVHCHDRGVDTLLGLVRQGLALAMQRAVALSKTSNLKRIAVLDGDTERGRHLCDALRTLSPEVRTVPIHAETVTSGGDDELASCTLALVPLFHDNHEQSSREIEVIRRLTSHHGRQLPVIAIVDEESTLGETALLAGAHELLPPFWSNEDLERAVRRARLRKLGEAHTRFLATHDPLTALINPATFEVRVGESLKRALRTRSTVALLYLDLDGFKPVNDRHGHRAGDLVLSEVGRRLRSVLEGSNAVARLGGDEFGLIIDDATDPRSALRLGHKILTLLSKPINLQDAGTASVSASIGIAFDDGRFAPAELIQAADQAMLSAKRAGKAQVRIAPNGTATTHHATLAADLERALHYRKLCVMYQQQLCLRTRRVAALSASLRWRLPLGQEVPAQAFLPVLEDTGMMPQAGRLLIDEVCWRAQKWGATGLETTDYHIALRVGLAELDDPSLLSFIHECLARYQLKAECLELQVTEETLLQSPQILQKLQSAGLKLAVVDFGYGASSLNCLRHWELHSIQLHADFITQLHQDKKTQTMVRTVIELAHSFGVKVVADGVQTQQQVELLRRLYCDRCQGNFFGRPHYVERARLQGPAPRPTQPLSATT